MQILARSNQLSLVAFSETDLARNAGLDPATPWENALVNMHCEPRWRTALRACISHDSYGMIKYLDPCFRQAVRHELARKPFDLIWLHTFNMVPYLDACFRHFQGQENRPLFVLDQHNVDEHYFGSFTKSKNLLVSTFASLEVRKNRILQKRWFPRFDVIFSVAPEDSDLTRRYVSEKVQVLVAPNGVDTDYFQPVELRTKIPFAPIVMFGASLDVTMNQDAVQWFVNEIWPLVRARFPDAQFWIVGRNPPAAIQALNGVAEITVTGTVADVREYYRRADVFVVPVRFGGGTKLKTLEGMALGLPVVSSSVGAQGLEVENGNQLLICDEPASFASAIIDLVADRTKALRMGKAARHLVENRYSWEGIVGKMDLQLRDLCMKRKVLNAKSVQFKKLEKPEY